MNRFRKEHGEPAQGGGGFNSSFVGKKHYGSGRSMPTVGKVTNKGGYKKRDVKAAARRDALMRRLS
tara:strand:+ start:441 stop:638 length:198 start_codon:yes stop_codon:yes gene_type:complete